MLLYYLYLEMTLTFDILQYLVSSTLDVTFHKKCEIIIVLSPKEVQMYSLLEKTVTDKTTESTFLMLCTMSNILCSVEPGV